LPFFREHEGKQYCVLHYPGNEKGATFHEALKRKLEAGDFNFYGVWFPGISFSGFEFDAPINFSYANFGDGASFSRASFNAKADFSHATFDLMVDFGHATFAEADFHDATFAIAEFRHATFTTALFYSATFIGPAYFSYANFDGAAIFNHATFKAGARFGDTLFCAEASFISARFDEEVDFSDAILKDYIRFTGHSKNPVFRDYSSLSLWLARIERPERASFHTLRLRPHWFVNVDARRFEFINVTWDWRGISSDKREIRSLNVDELSARRLLAIACRNLAVNAEENHRYEEASRFRYMAMEARRLERWRGFAFWTLGWWYWLASGYGERVWRAFVVLIGVWLVAAALYTRVGFARWEPRVATEKEAAEARRDEVGEPLRWPRALTYSLGVMTLQKPEPRPATNAAQSLVMLETILGPVQAALLALAIRRKFMR
jgi:uncharacterized protein YjbI with pentapeptide repeats